METATQITFILFHILVGSLMFAVVGQEPEGENRTKATSIAALIYGAFTIGFIIWWETPDMGTMIAKCIAIALMWVPWLIDLRNINKPPVKLGVRDASIGALFIVARISVVLIFWVL